MPISTAGKLPSSQSGFTYVVVLVMAVVLGIVAEAAETLTSHAAQVEKESELLFRGLAYQKAIRSYYLAGGVYPRSLEDLLKDPRFASRRHLRALYSDPMGDGTLGWALIRASDGGISGVASQSQQEPIKKAYFTKGLEKFQAATSYSGWIFEYVPEPGLLRPPGQPATSSPAGPPVIRTN